MSKLVKGVLIGAGIVFAGVVALGIKEYMAPDYLDDFDDELTDEELEELDNLFSDEEAENV